MFKQNPEIFTPCGGANPGVLLREADPSITGFVNHPLFSTSPLTFCQKHRDLFKKLHYVFKKHHDVFLKTSPCFFKHITIFLRKHHDVFVETS
jgi:hypothetical protein